MSVVILICSYLLLIAGSLVPIALFGLEIMHRLRISQPLITGFTTGFAAVVLESITLQLVVWDMMVNPAISWLPWLYSGTFAMWVASIAIWLYATLRGPKVATEHAEVSHE